MFFKTIYINCKPNKMWINKGSDFYNRSMTLRLQDNDIVKYPAHNEGKSVVAERFIRTLRKKITNIRLQYVKMCILIN